MNVSDSKTVYWRVEGSLLNLSTVRPVAQHLGVDRLIANRLEFRDGYATGRLLDPVIRPRGALARLTGGSPDGQRSWEQLLRDLGLERQPEMVLGAALAAQRQVSPA